MWWFVLGALLGVIQLVVRFYREPPPPEANNLLVGFVLSAVLGAVLYGSILWLVFSLIF
jgi:hypothetical protein